jgi:flagellar FliJ protein
MVFKFRLETSLRLAKQELDIAQGLLAEELRILQEAKGQKDNQTRILAQAFQGQKKACLEKPRDLSLWQQYSSEQKDKLRDYVKIVEEQEKTVAEYRARLVECRIKVEKFKRLKEKQKSLFDIKELRKEQTVIDEIAQNQTMANKI